MDLSTAQVRGQEAKELVALKKETEVLKQMKEEFSLINNTPKTGGSGTTNNDNTARTAFRNQTKFALILSFSQDLVYRF